MKKIGLIGLGKIGQNIALNLLSKNYYLIAYNRSPEKTKRMQKRGAIPSYSLEELTGKLMSPRIILLTLTAGQPVDNAIANLLYNLKEGDIIIDGGNSFYKDTIRRYNILKRKGIYFIDMGISGGIYGARHGASLMIGGDKNAFKKIEFLCKDLAIKGGYVYLGSSGAGHFAKMVHNAIEYAMLEAYGEGLELLEKSPYKYNYKDIVKVWNNGSVIRSYITELMEKVLTRNPKLKNIQGIIGGGETGKWAEEFAKSVNVEAESLKHAIKKRRISEKKQSLSTKLISALRHEFGGHPIKKKKNSFIKVKVYI